MILCVGLGFLDAALDVAHGIQVLAEARAIPGPDFPFKAGDVLAEPIEQTGAFAQCRHAIDDAAAFAKQALEHNPGMRLGGQRRRRRGPGEIVLIDTGVTVVALADDLHEVHRQLQRGQLSLLADVLSGDLVHGRAEVIIRAFGQLRLGGAEECGIGSRMTAGIGVLQFHV